MVKLKYTDSNPMLQLTPMRTKLGYIKTFSYCEADNGIIYGIVSKNVLQFKFIDGYDDLITILEFNENTSTDLVSKRFVDTVKQFGYKLYSISEKLTYVLKNQLCIDILTDDPLVDLINQMKYIKINL